MAFAYYSSVDIKSLKTEISNKKKKMVFAGFFSGLFRSMTKIGLPLAKNVITPLAKSVLMPLTLTTAAFLLQEQHY